MLIVGIIFVLATVASIRSSMVYERAVSKNAPKRRLKHLETAGITYTLIAFVLAFAIVGTIETAL